MQKLLDRDQRRNICQPPHHEIPDDQAYDNTLIDGITTRYYDYIKKGVNAPPTIVASRAAIIPSNPDSASVLVAGGDCVPSKARITKEDLTRHGYTPGCPGCLAAQLGDGSRQFRRHTNACRERMSQLIPVERAQKAKEKSRKKHLSCIGIHSTFVHILHPLFRGRPRNTHPRPCC